MKKTNREASEVCRCCICRDEPIEPPRQTRRTIARLKRLAAAVVEGLKAAGLK